VGLSKSYYTWNVFNESKNYRFKDINSKNLPFLSIDKNLRSISNLKLSKSNRNLTNQTNIGFFINKNMELTNNQVSNYTNSLLKYVNPVSLQKLISTNVSLTDDRNPVSTNNLK
jgi:hypothetical protein